MIRVFAIDPGMNHTGIALVNDRGIVRACSINFNQPCKTDRAKMTARCAAICEKLDELLAAWKHDVVVIETFDIHHDVQSNAISATQGIFLESWLWQHLEGENVHPQTPAEAHRPNMLYSAYWYMGIDPRSLKGLEKEEQLRILADAMPGGVNCHGNRDQIQAASHGLKYIYDRQRLF